MECYIVGGDVALVLIHWIGTKLLKTFKPPYKLVVWGDHTLTFNEFTTLFLCDSQCYKASHTCVFQKVFRQGCDWLNLDYVLNAHVDCVVVSCAF
jgi:hypothetical protein